MKITVKPSCFDSEIWANPSKSIMQRVIALAALSSGETLIDNRDNSLDSKSAIGVTKAMGADISSDDYRVFIGEKSGVKNTLWNVGESGLSARVFAPIAGLFEQEITITGEGSLMNRPMDSVVLALEQLGLKVSHNNYFLPISIKGEIKNHSIELDLSSGSQLLTGLLIALSKSEKDSEILVKNLKSKPYIDLTICVLKGFGIEVKNNNYTHFSIKGNQNISRNKFIVEGDWSGVAFHVVGAAISGKVTITGINPRSKQPDRAILDVLQNVGAKVKIKHNKVIVEKGDLKAFEFDATDAPDLFPPLAVLAAYCDGISKIKGVSRLKHKESDRFKTLKKEFGKVGIKIIQEDDFMLVEGNTPSGGKVNSHNDHRIAMAMATLGLGAKGNIEINGAECVSKSYPDYFLDYKILGGEILDG